MNATIRNTMMAAGLAAALAAAGCSASNAEPTDPVARGKYLVVAGSCADCHAPKKMGKSGPEIDMDRYLSGAQEDAKLPTPPALPEGPWIATASWDLTAWSGPWGVSYAMNLTPDEGTGIGMWTEDMFVKALRTGKHMGVGRPILPPMPWENIRNLTDDDLKAMYAYLRSLPPISNRVPQPVPPATAHAPTSGPAGSGAAK